MFKSKVVCKLSKRKKDNGLISCQEIEDALAFIILMEDVTVGFN